MTPYALRGYGHSTSDGTTPIAHVDDLAALLQALNVRRASLVGLSLGGMIAMEYAVAHPDNVANLVLVSSGLRGVQPKNAAEQQEFFSKLGACKSKRCGIDLLLSSPLFASGTKEGCYAAHAATMLEDNWDTLRLMKLYRWPEHAIVDNLPRVKARTLVIIGEADDPAMHDFAEVLPTGSQEHDVCRIPMSAII